GDTDGKGHLDIVKTHCAGDTNVFYENTGKGRFEDATLKSGLGVETRYVGWGAVFGDFDNDGWPDLFVVTGHVYPEVEPKLPQYPFPPPPQPDRDPGTGPFR